jgi:hypothetical protein
MLGPLMSDTFLKVVILGLPLGFSLMWFAYWVVKIFKARERLRRRASQAPVEPVAPDADDPSGS